MEIERKWLVRKENIPYNLDELEHYDIEQAYVSFEPTIRIRKIEEQDKYILTVKTKLSGSVAREEFETGISSEEYYSMLYKSEGNIVKKTRYFNRRPDGLVEEIDVFTDNLEGLCYCEIEFPDVEMCEAFPDLPWAEADVTTVKGFSNGDLALYGMPDLTDLRG